MSSLVLPDRSENKKINLLTTFSGTVQLTGIATRVFVRACVSRLRTFGRIDGRTNLALPLAGSGRFLVGVDISVLANLL
jgi:hypothetical protein